LAAGFFCKYGERGGFLLSCAVFTVSVLFHTLRISARGECDFSSEKYAIVDAYGTGVYFS
jgi:hypothetical protein